MSSYTGRAQGLAQPLMAVVTTRLPWRRPDKPLALLVKRPEDLTGLTYRLLGRRRLAAVLAGPEVPTEALDGLPGVVDLPPEAMSLKDGDVVFMEPGGRVAVFYEAGSIHNCIFATNRCNARCLMCPQPPGDDPPDLWESNLALIGLLDPERTTCLAITGGEPTLLGDKLLTLIRRVREQAPKALITLLSNGRRLKNLDFAKALVEAGYPALLVEVPLFADTDTEHDRIMGAEGAFWDTMAGLHNLARLGQPVGLRTVLSALTIPRLTPYAEFVYRNLPFVTQVAFMGMETRGLAEENLEQLWIDPYDYREELSRAVRHLHRRLVPVSIYNHPLCVLTPDTWPFARQAITTWKQWYPPVCDTCARRADCGGVFGTGVKVSEHLHPLS